MHQTEWQRLTVDEKLEHLRLHQAAQDGLTRAMLLALERLGVRFADESDEAFRILEEIRCQRI